MPGCVIPPINEEGNPPGIKFILTFHQLIFMRLLIFILIGLMLVKFVVAEEITFKNALEEFINQVKKNFPSVKGIGCEPAEKILNGMEVKGIKLTLNLKEIGIIDGLKEIWTNELFEGCRLKLTWLFLKFKLFG